MRPHSTFHTPVSCWPGSTPPIGVPQNNGGLRQTPLPTTQFPDALAPSFTVRTRREVNTQDAANARMYGTMDIGFRPPLRAVMDEAPIASRGVSGAQYTAAPDLFGRALGAGPSPARNPTSTAAPGILANPYMGRMDVSQDPRNAVREGRSAFVEDNTDADVYLANRFMSREGVTRFIPSGASDGSAGKPGDKGAIDHTLAAYEQLRAQNSNFVTTQTRRW